MKFIEQSGITIEQAFRIFDRKNPAIYEMFERFAFFLIRDKKKKKIGAKMIMERIRWEKYIETTGDEFKINNNFTAHYVRKFIAKYPHLESYFELRKIRNPEQIKNPKQTTLF